MSNHNEYTLSNQVVDVIGAGHGIGRAISLGLAEVGATIAVTGRYIHVVDDIDDMISRLAEIIEKDLYGLRL